MTVFLFHVRLFLDDTTEHAFALDAVGPDEATAIARARAILADKYPSLRALHLTDGPGYARLVRVADSSDVRAAKFPPHPAR